jgi:hypothetical protein
MKIAIDTNHNVIPKPEPPIACGKALKGGLNRPPNSQDQIQQIMTKSLLNWIKEQPIKHIHKTGYHVPQFEVVSINY